MPTIDYASCVADVIRNRRSINNFKPEVPPHAELIKAIDSARWAPNHRLSEPWHFHICGPETRQAILDLEATLTEEKSGPKVAEKKRARWARVPGFLAVTCELSEDALREREDYAATACAIQNLMLQLWAMGIGCKWTTGDITRDPRFYDLIWADPLQQTVVGLIWYGYPSEETESRRQPAETISTELP